MATYLLPNIGTTGAIKLKVPFTGLCAENVPYQVSGISTLHEIVSSGQDPFEMYYEPNSITEEKFLQDAADGVCIISLVSPTGETVRVPNSYLESLPIATGVPYSVMMVAVNLGALPHDLSLTYFMTKVGELAHDLLGIAAPEVRAVKASTTTYLTLEDAASIEAARKVVMDTVVTTEARLAESEAARLALVALNADLEAYIVANHIPPAPPP